MMRKGFCWGLLLLLSIVPAALSAQAIADDLPFVYAQDGVFLRFPEGWSAVGVVDATGVARGAIANADRVFEPGSAIIRFTVSDAAVIETIRGVDDAQPITIGDVSGSLITGLPVTMDLPAKDAFALVWEPASGVSAEFAITLLAGERDAILAQALAIAATLTVTSDDAPAEQTTFCRDQLIFQHPASMRIVNSAINPPSNDAVTGDLRLNIAIIDAADASDQPKTTLNFLIIADTQSDLLGYPADADAATALAALIFDDPTTRFSRVGQIDDQARFAFVRTLDDGTIVNGSLSADRAIPGYVVMRGYNLPDSATPADHQRLTYALSTLEFPRVSDC